jgi:hypothetical protein
MHKVEHIYKMLVDELVDHVDNFVTVKRDNLYYNEILGNTSFLLAGLLGSILNSKNDQWVSNKWFDDSLITRISYNNGTFRIYGIMIWGKKDTTEQWTEPFGFVLKIYNIESYAGSFDLYFGNLDRNEISYELYKMDQSHWSDNVTNWRFIIKSSEVMNILCN